MKTFDTFALEVKTVDGGSIVTASLILDGAVQEQVTRVVAGRPGLPITGSRTRKAIRALVEGAFPRMKLVGSSDLEGQQMLPGVT